MSKNAIGVEQAAVWFRELQDAICDAFAALDGKGRFIEDLWERPGGGGGRSRVMSGGDVFEQGGVNFSHVHGDMDPRFAGQLPGSGTRFQATGVSIVMHPRSPMVPGFHANVRMIAKGDRVWAGGGMDLTPYYAKTEDAVHFHRTLRDACDKHHSAWYPRFKDWCDEYFYLPHRGETRGIGGIFYDYVGVPWAELPAPVQERCPRALKAEVPRADAWRFCREIGRAILEAYVPIVESRRATPYGEPERQFQLYRRGRYVEFNLLYDRGTHFGLKTGGRTESILMSLPPLVRWTYDFRPQPGSREAGLMDFLKPRDWLGEAEAQRASSDDADA